MSLKRKFWRRLMFLGFSSPWICPRHCEGYAAQSLQAQMLEPLFLNCAQYKIDWILQSKSPPPPSICGGKQWLFWPYLHRWYQGFLSWASYKEILLFWLDKTSCYHALKKLMWQFLWKKNYMYMCTIWAANHQNSIWWINIIRQSISI